MLNFLLSLSFSPRILELEAKGFSPEVVLVGDSHHASSSLMKLSPSLLVQLDFHDGVGEPGEGGISGERRPFLTE